MKTTWNATVLSCAVLLFAATGRAQQPSPAPPPTPAPVPRANIVPLKVDVVIVKYQNGKTISRTPYSLSLNTNAGKASLRMGAEVPIPTIATSPQAPGGVPITTPVQYKNIGTNIDCFAQTFDGNRYRIDVSIEDTSVYPSGADMPGTVAGAPTLRTFQASNELLLRNGQTAEFMAATDKVSGEVIKAEVTLTVLE